MELTSKNIETAQPGQILRDATIKGLHLKVTSDRKSFFLYYRSKARDERRPKLGDYPTLKLAQVREIARKMLVVVAEGRDPMLERQADRDAPTMAELCAKYLAEYAPRKKSARRDEETIDRIVLPKLGKRRVAQIEYDDVSALHTSLAATPYQANRILALLSRMFNLAERWKYRSQNSNPCRHVQRYPEKKRRRIMSPDEARAIAAALQRYEPTRPAPVAFIYLLIMTAARKSEIAAARWEWLDGAILRLPDSKTGAKPLYLPQQAVTLIGKLPRVDGQTILGIADPTALWRVVRKEAGCPDLRMHDLRRTFASAALSAGYSLNQIGELLGHASQQTTAGYAYLMPQPAAQAVDVIASKMEAMMAPAA